MLAWKAYASRSNRKPVDIELSARPVVIEMKAELSGVSADESILSIQVRYIDLLIPKTKATEINDVQFAVGILFEHFKECEVELPSIRPEVTKETRSEICITENESTKIARKGLQSEAQTCRIKVR